MPKRDFRDVVLRLPLRVPGGTEEVVGAALVRTFSGLLPVFGELPVRELLALGRFEDDGGNGVDGLGAEKVLGRMSGAVHDNLQGVPDDTGVVV